jgi:hypothetical protein
MDRFFNIPDNAKAEILRNTWKKDYSTMQEQMIYADSPGFESMLEFIKNYISKINQLNWQII